jgi:mono/diheme cytochrome c family protein
MNPMLSVFLLAGCNSDPIAERVDAIAALSGDADAGGEGYDLYCAQCHAADGGGVSTDPELNGPPINGLAVEEVAINLLDPGPAMPSFRSLTDQEIADIAAWVFTL